MHQPDIIEKVKPLIYNILQENKIELVDITYRRESGGNVLRILADTDSGITIGECARMNNVISDALDVSNLMEDRYIIEISSPGLDRPLKAKSDFLKARGKNVRVHTYTPVENRKEFAGKLEDIDDEKMSISIDNGIKISISFDKISSARLDF